MEQKTQGGRQTLANVASVTRKAWLNILLILAALVLVVLGMIPGGELKVFGRPTSTNPSFKCR